MMRSALVVAAFLAMAGAALAQDDGPSTVMPDGFDRAAALNAVHATMAEAPNETAARIATQEMWRLHFLAPDQPTADAMNRAMRMRRSYNLDGAAGVIDEIIERWPGYAEAWNQRGTIRFLKRDFDGAVEACRTTLSLQPRHLGCLTGLATIFIRYADRPQAGFDILRRALALNAFLPERAMLPQSPQPEQ